jgi:hypothetical protein
VVTEVAGKLRFEDFIDGVTVQSKTTRSPADLDGRHRPQAASVPPARTCGPVVIAAR